MFRNFLAIFIAVIATVYHVTGHGRLMEPPNRSSLWRFSEYRQYNPPVNYNDNENFCGGASVSNHNLELKADNAAKTFEACTLSEKHMLLLCRFKIKMVADAVNVEMPGMHRNPVIMRTVASMAVVSLPVATDKDK